MSVKANIGDSVTSRKIDQISILMSANLINSNSLTVKTQQITLTPSFRTLLQLKDNDEK
jgi:hypothetical protein